jgi:hypothetical protein
MLTLIIHLFDLEQKYLIRKYSCDYMQSRHNADIIGWDYSSKASTTIFKIISNQKTCKCRGEASVHLNIPPQHSLM